MKSIATFLIVFIILGIWGYYFYSQNKISFLPKNSISTLSKPVDTNVPLFPSATLTPQRPSMDDDIAQIKKSFADKYGRKISDVDLNITDDDGTHAIGTATFRLAMAGGHILAAKAAGAWVIAQDGNGSVMCDAVSPYSFPKTMVPECVDSKGKLVKL